MDAPTALTLLLEQARTQAGPVVLASVRLAPVVWLAPTFGGRLLPVPARTGLVLLLAVLLAGGAPPVALSPAAFAREAALGIALGLLCALPFEAARGGGQLVDVFRGASIGEVLIPTTRERAGPTADLLYLGALALVAAAAGDRLVLRALGQVFALLPPGAGWAPEGSTALAQSALTATSALIACALSLAAPVLVTSLLIDLLLGVVGRVAPQLPLFFLGLPAKASVGLLVVALGAGILLDRLAQEVSGGADAITATAAALTESVP